MQNKKPQKPKPVKNPEGDLLRELHLLQVENAYLKKVTCLNPGKNCQRERERARAIHGLRRDYVLSDLLKVSGMARSTFYYYLKRLSGPDKYQEEKNLIEQIFHANKGRYGYRRIWMELRREGFLINHKTVCKLMNIVGVKWMVRAKKYNFYKGAGG